MPTAFYRLNWWQILLFVGIGVVATYRHVRAVPDATVITFIGWSAIFCIAVPVAAAFVSGWIGGGSRPRFLYALYLFAVAQILLSIKFK